MECQATITEYLVTQFAFFGMALAQTIAAIIAMRARSTRARVTYYIGRGAQFHDVASFQHFTNMLRRKISASQIAGVVAITMYRLGKLVKTTTFYE